MHINKGKQRLIQLHDEIYKQIIPNHFNKSIKYIPHITIGKCNDIKKVDAFKYEFVTIVDEVSIELIGEPEESIIIKNIKLGGLL